MLMNGFGLGNMRSARVADQVDAEIAGARNIINSTKMVAGQFDFLESQLQQLAQLIGQAEPSLAMQMQSMQASINNIQQQILGGLTQVEQSLTKMDSLTDKIQN